MLFISYEAWKEKQQTIMTDDDLVECPDCKGYGEKECECCGVENTCKRCDGEGKARWGDLLEYERAYAFTPEEYRRLVLDEANAYGDWTGKDPIELLYQEGFSPWQDLRNKKVHINNRPD